VADRLACPLDWSCNFHARVVRTSAKWETKFGGENHLGKKHRMMLIWRESSLKIRCSWAMADTNFVFFSKRYSDLDDKVVE
jgi:hypothetical protein